MRTIGLAGVRLRRRHRTTFADQTASKAPDLIGRDFTAVAVNTKYVGDITYLPVSGARPLCLATVIDLASRRLAGWAIADHMRTELVIDALAAAERTRGSLGGAVMHTDHGSQYTSRAFAEICRSAGIRQSMGAIGSSADNAAAESFNAAFKRETLKGRKAWPNEREARLEAFRWLTVTTPGAGIPASVSGLRSPTRTTSNPRQLPWPKRHRRVQNLGSRPKAG
jgi:transposase InsO family protein